jgi:hypothetical protein
MDEMTDNRVINELLRCPVCEKVTQHLNGKCKVCTLRDVLMPKISMSDYIIFAGSTYYPTGGMEDLLSFASSIDEGIETIGNWMSDEDNQWAHIYGVKEQEVVWRTGSTLYTKFHNNLQI